MSGSGSWRKRSMCGMKSYIGGHRIRAHRRGAAAQLLTASATASADPSASASGFSWQTVSTSRAARMRATTSAGHATAMSAAGQRRGRHCRCPSTFRASLGGGNGASLTRRWGGQRLGQLGQLALPALLELIEDLQHARAAGGGLVLLDVQLGDALQAQSAQPLAHERHRAGQRSQVSRFFSSAAPMTDTHTLAWRRSGVTSTSVIVTKPMRGIIDLAP